MNAPSALPICMISEKPRELPDRSIGTVREFAAARASRHLLQWAAITYLVRTLVARAYRLDREVIVSVFYVDYSGLFHR